MVILKLSNECAGACLSIPCSTDQKEKPSVTSSTVEVDEATSPAEITTALRVRVLFVLTQMGHTELDDEPTRELAERVYDFGVLANGEGKVTFGEVRNGDKIYPLQGYFGPGHKREVAIHAVDICIWHLRANYLATEVPAPAGT